MTYRCSYHGEIAGSKRNPGADGCVGRLGDRGGRLWGRARASLGVRDAEKPATATVWLWPAAERFESSHVGKAVKLGGDRGWKESTALQAGGSRCRRIRSTT